MNQYFENSNLVSEIKLFSFRFKDNSFSFNTDNGVFSKGELDYGSYLLLKNVFDKVSGNILDLGCGYGPIGIVLNKLTKANVVMSDINKRAIHLANMNIKLNHSSNVETILSDGFNDIGNRKFDYIVSNPPIRVGKEKLYELIYNAKNYLCENGVIYVVIRKKQGADSFIRDMKKVYDVNIIDKDKGFLIISLK